MTPQPKPDTLQIKGRVDAHGRLVSADPELAGLHERAGGKSRGALAVPQIATLARLARRLGIVISRPVIAADGDRDIDLWVRAEPSGDEVDLFIGGWTERPAYVPAEAPKAEREADFLRAAADWVWETDDALRFTSISPTAAAVVGRPREELIGKQLTRLFRFQEGEDGALPILNALAEQRRFDDQIAELRGGTTRYRLSGVPLIDGAGRFAGFRGSAASLPSWLPAGEAEEGSASAPDVGLGSPAFGARLDEALRRPLNHIIANAETITARPEGPLRRDYAGYASDIAAAGRHLLALVDDLVDLQAIERPDFRPEMEEIDLADVARRAAGLLSVRAMEKDLGFERPAEEEHLLALGEFRRVLQILMNLLSNAIRYSPEGAEVSIRVGQQEGFACAVVTDLGKGISDQDQARIFDKFERVDPTEPGGTGLGLYIARRLARAMGGDILVESRAGEGARFTLRLPAAER